MHKSGSWVEYEDGNKIETEEWEQYTNYQVPNYNDLYVGDYISNNYWSNNPTIREVKFHYGKIVLERIKGDGRSAKIITLDDWRKWKDNGYYIVGNKHEGETRG